MFAKFAKHCITANRYMSGQSNERFPNETENRKEKKDEKQTFKKLLIVCDNSS